MITYLIMGACFGLAMARSFREGCGAIILALIASAILSCAIATHTEPSKSPDKTILMPEAGRGHPDDINHYPGKGWRLE